MEEKTWLAELLPVLHTFLSVQLYLVEEESEVSLSEGQGQVGSGSHTASLSLGQGGLNYEDPFGLERKQKGWGWRGSHFNTFHTD